MRSSLIYLGMFLGVICLVSATSLAVTHEVADPLIRQHQAAQRAAALSRVLPEADHFAEVTEEYAAMLDDPEFSDVQEIIRAHMGEETIGYVLTVSPRGYAAKIDLMVGISGEEVTGLRILRQAETPGLGARIAEDSFQRQFSGLPAREQVATTDDGGQIDTLTGATESTRAVVRGAEQARLLYQRISEER